MSVTNFQSSSTVTVEGSVIKIAQKTVHFSPGQTYSQPPLCHLWEAFSHAVFNMRRIVHKCALLSIARHSQIQLSDLNVENVIF